MNYRLLVVSVLWLIAIFAYAASLASVFWTNKAKAVGVIAVVLLAIGALITRSEIYTNLYDSRASHAANSADLIIKTLSWMLFLCTCLILTLYFSMPDGRLAKSNNALLSIFAFITFFSGRSLLLRPFQSNRKNLR